MRVVWKSVWYVFMHKKMPKPPKPGAPVPYDLVAQSAALESRKGDAETFALEIKDLGSLGVFSTLWDELSFTALINGYIPSDSQQLLTPGIALKLLILNLVEGRSPLYRVEDWAALVPLDLLGGADVLPKHLNDTSLGRHLERVFSAGGEGLLNVLCMRVARHEQLSMEQFHGDTTSRILFGEYKNSHAESDAVYLTYGHSKDHRPDLKQVMYGVSMHPDGVLASGQLLSGNTSDKPWHGGMLDLLQREYRVKSKHGGGKPIHYVGDSALVTPENLAFAHENGMVLTSRLPKTYALTNSSVLMAVHGGLSMEPFVGFSEEEGGAHFEGCLLQGTELYGRAVQLGVYRSSGGMERVRRSLLRKQAKSLLQAEKAALRLMKERYCCADDAQKALDDFETAHLETTFAERLLAVSGRVIMEQMEALKPRGRPKMDAVPAEKAISYRLEIVVSAEEKNLGGLIGRESCFVLVHTGTTPISAREILAVYKGQSVVEKRFPFLKDPSMAEVFFVKNPKRLEALGYVMLMALLLWSVLERRVRMNLDASGEGPVVDTTGMKKKKPTSMVCRHILNGIKMMRVKTTTGYTPWQLSAPLKKEQLRIMRFSQAVKPPPTTKEKITELLN